MNSSCRLSFRVPTCALTGVAVLFVALLACSTKPVQTVPAANPSSTGPSDSTVIYNVPIPTDSEGTVRVTSLGRHLIRSKETDEPLPAIGIRFEITNQRDFARWVLDSRLQTLQLAEGVRLGPAFVRSSDVDLPFIEVDPGETRTADFYFVLPARFQGAEDVQSLSVYWHLRAADEMISHETSFKTVGPVGDSLNVYPFDPSPPISSPDEREPASTRPQGPDPNAVGVETDWWMDPFADLPFPWRTLVR